MIQFQPPTLGRDTFHLLQVLLNLALGTSRDPKSCRVLESWNNKHSKHLGQG